LFSSCSAVCLPLKNNPTVLYAREEWLRYIQEVSSNVYAKEEPQSNESEKREMVKKLYHIYIIYIESTSIA
jgi:hypothetical protein